MESAFLEAIKENTDFEGLLVTELSPGATKFCPASPVPLHCPPHPARRVLRHGWEASHPGPALGHPLPAHLPGASRSKTCCISHTAAPRAPAPEPVSLVVGWEGRGKAPC